MLNLCGGGRNILTEPDDEIFKGEVIGLVKPCDETIRRVGVGGDARTVDGKKSVGGGKSRALVAVNEWMVLRKAFPQGGRLLDQVGVVACLRSIEGGFENAVIPHVRNPP